MTSDSRHLTVLIVGLFVTVGSGTQYAQRAQYDLQQLATLLAYVESVSVNPMMVAYVRPQIFSQAATILGRLAHAEVRLIGERNTNGRATDELIHQIEDQSYQLKTLLLQLQSLKNQNSPVSYPPRNVQYAPITPAGQLPGGYPQQTGAYSPQPSAYGAQPAYGQQPFYG